MNDKDFKILFSQEEIEKRIKILAQEIDEKYGDQPLTFICVLKVSLIRLLLRFTPPPRMSQSQSI